MCRVVKARGRAAEASLREEEIDTRILRIQRRFVSCRPHRYLAVTSCTRLSRRSKLISRSGRREDDFWESDVVVSSLVAALSLDGGDEV